MSDSLISREALRKEKEELQRAFEAFKAQGLSLNMARGKPSAEQIRLSDGFLTLVTPEDDFQAGGQDIRNYGLPEGIPAARKLMGDLLGVPDELVLIGTNSSLNLMFDAVTYGYTKGFSGCEPWCRQENAAFLCPVPGYDRHFAITEHYGIRLIPIPMTETGPDMDQVEEYVEKDPCVKGMWCVPKYSNPGGVTYSDETVRRIASLKPAAKDFRVYWDNAYVVHDLYEEGDTLLNFYEECCRAGNPELGIQFCSFAKILYPSSGISAMAAGPETAKEMQRHFSFQTIGRDKVNQLRCVKFFRDVEGIKAHMKKHAAILRPKFEAVLAILEEELGGRNVASWSHPRGGYFISVDVLPGCAKRVVALCKEGGVTMTGAGAAFPYKQDPNDSNIRVAPSLPPVADLEKAMELFCLCVRLAAVEKQLGELS
ncbi:MAG: aminotransferase class I/II-fold pyridoxal phosphate-dependent enzyme [Candidatus Heritagella sp.]|nr:aminotransferase class I/II-fold pyridoxal phosphate-dependent enzyme [Candidatus Heritagella sp.]